MGVVGRMSDRGERRGVRAAPIWVFLLVALAALTPVACGGTSDSAGEGAGALVEQKGSIDADDTRDPDHSDLAYDAYTFEAKSGDEVSVDVTAEGFVPLLKLVEVSTGAVIAEWDAAYPDGAALTSTIAGPGEYEARVYAQEDGTGPYALSVRVNP